MKKEKMKKFKNTKPYMSNWAKRKLQKYKVMERENSIGNFNMKQAKGVYFDADDLKEMDEFDFDFHGRHVKKIFKHKKAFLRRK